MNEDRVESVAVGFNFTGCTSNNPDICACATHEDTECPLCEEPIVDGQVIITVTRLTFPYEDPEDPENGWETFIWHKKCPEESD